MLLLLIGAGLVLTSYFVAPEFQVAQWVVGSLAMITSFAVYDIVAAIKGQSK